MATPICALCETETHGLAVLIPRPGEEETSPAPAPLTLCFWCALNIKALLNRILEDFQCDEDGQRK